jgi:hypothetical protein
MGKRRRKRKRKRKRKREGALAVNTLMDFALLCFKLCHLKLKKSLRIVKMSC